MGVRPLEPPQEAMWRSLMRLSVAVPRMLGENTERVSGLSGTQYALLLHLSEAPGRRLTMTGLSERVSVSRGQISRVVDELSRAGLVRRVPNEGDGRSALAQLTDAGFEMFCETYPTVLSKVHEYVFDHLSAAEVRVVGDVLGRLVEVVDAER